MLVGKPDIIFVVAEDVDVGCVSDDNHIISGIVIIKDISIYFGTIIVVELGKIVVARGIVGGRLRQTD